MSAPTSQNKPTHEAIEEFVNQKLGEAVEFQTVRFYIFAIAKAKKYLLSVMCNNRIHWRASECTTLFGVGCF